MIKPTDLLRRLLYYPYESAEEPAKGFLSHLEKTNRERADQFSAFCEYVESVKNSRLEELYIQTFDVQAVCSLDVGYVLFGEDYNRGQFMAQLKELHRKHGVDLGSELPDFLPNVLVLLERLPREDAALLVTSFVYPAVEKMLAQFDGSTNIYRLPIAAVRDVLKDAYFPTWLPVAGNTKEQVCMT